MKTITLILDRTTIVSLDASAMKGIETFDICDYAKKYMAEHGYTNPSEYGYEINFTNYVIYIDALTIREIELAIEPSVEAVTK